MYLMDSNPVNNRKWNLGRMAGAGDVWNMPVVPGGAQNPSPVTGDASNGGITTVMATRPSTNPLDYTSPQAAIAAGLDPVTVYSKWTAALARFSSPQAAISAGVPAGVVNQLWQQSYQNSANKAAKKLGRMGLQPVRLPNLGRMGVSSGTSQGWRRLRGMRGLGDDYTDALNQINASQNVMSDPTGTFITDLNTGNVLNAQTGQIQKIDGSYIPQTASSGYTVPVTPADYTTTPGPTGAANPYALKPTQPSRSVLNPITGALTVIQGTAPAAAPSGTIFGLSPTTLLAAGVGLVALTALGGGGGRRR